MQVASALPTELSNGTKLITEPTTSDYVGFTQELYLVIDEGDGIWRHPLELERTGENSSPLKVRIVFAKPSVCYEEEKFPVESNSAFVVWGKGETGKKLVSVIIKPQQVHDIPLLLQILLKVDSNSTTTILPDRSTAALKVVAYGQAPQDLKQKAESFYTERKVSMNRDKSKYMRPIIAN